MQGKSNGKVVGLVTIGLTVLCLLATPVFSPALMFAAIIGVVGGLVTFLSGARQLATWLFVLALAPMLGTLLLQSVYQPATDIYMLAASLVAAIGLMAVGGRLIRT